MRKTLFALALVSVSCTAFAQSPASPVGRWKTIDDETGKAMSITEVYQAKNGTFAAKVVEALDPKAATCTACSGDKKGKPTAGMVVLWDLKPAGNAWGNGQGFKPSTGDNFKVKSVKLVDGGQKLEITGCKMSFLCRTATWQRAN
ncbi:DUF2147 domain-containing protein [Cognatilysobacter bugurensis]|uniref:DUF2147 domain-containing protein n=1 Tax=Cognatilysobacter bugurensis TaxID=543356 RepID=A0A918W6F0_9GAMM|nr:DUF2147 domain-containing protein [Lysobacter bugurensis]GHA70868.1 hypothetical protein GCM10007067_03900 [Lysobacter bugurensis]